MSIATILAQIVITSVVVGIYHLWATRKKGAAPPPLVPVVIAPVAPPPKPVPVTETVPPEILAVIAAAVAVVIGRPHRVVAVEAASTPVVNVWALEGRVEQFLSHKIR